MDPARHPQRGESRRRVERTAVGVRGSLRQHRIRVRKQRRRQVVGIVVNLRVFCQSLSAPQMRRHFLKVQCLLCCAIHVRVPLQGHKIVVYLSTFAERGLLRDHTHGPTC